MSNEQVTTEAIIQRVIDLYCAQEAANTGKIDLEELKRCVALAIWGDAWSDDLLDQLPPRIARCLDKIVNAALLKHGFDQMLDDVAARD